MQEILISRLEFLGIQRKSVAKSDVDKRSDKIIDFFLLSYFLAGIALSFFYDTWSIGLGVGGLSLLAYYVPKLLLPESTLYQYTLSGILGIFMAQYIYQMHGLFEMHFFAFIGSAILITYQNWKLQIPIMVVVTVHHGVFGYLQDSGFRSVYFTQLDYFPLVTFLIHILLAAAIFFISGLWAYQLKKYSRIKEEQTREMERLQQEAFAAVTAQKDQLERHISVLDKAVAQGKFEIASDVTHDIGNAVVGFGTYITRVKRLQEEQNPQILQNLAHLFNMEKSVIAKALGEEKASAVIKVLSGLAETQGNHREEIGQIISKQMDIIANIQEILHIQRQHIEGHEAQERKPVNLRNIINDALALLFLVIEQHAVAIHVDIPDDLPPISGDRTKLIQVIVNILKNSIEAIGLHADEKVIFVRVFRGECLLMLEIRDTGKGLDKDGEDQLLQVDRTGRPDSAGLTMNSCRTIIETHGGTMTMVSEGPGKGTTTSIQFSL